LTDLGSQYFDLIGEDPDLRKPEDVLSYSDQVQVVIDLIVRAFVEKPVLPSTGNVTIDVILAGGAILYLAMEELECSSALISCHGVRYGLLYKKLNP
jgi:exopolyphosphatase/pppGpp-phosphohydrolase